MSFSPFRVKRTVIFKGFFISKTVNGFSPFYVFFSPSLIRYKS